MDKLEMAKMTLEEAAEAYKKEIMEFMGRPQERQPDEKERELEVPKMREILFRGVIVPEERGIDKTPKWVYGGIHQHFWEEGENAFIYNEQNYSYKVTNETIGQFTGLLDKNGKKIFEGDIVEFKTDIIAKFDEVGCLIAKDYWKDFDEHELKRIDQAIVQWNKRSGMWDLKVYNNGMYKRKSKLFTFRYSGVEIIGNIHDNPELLEMLNDTSN